jgi:hypothetical protein
VTIEGNDGEAKHGLAENLHGGHSRTIRGRTRTHLSTCRTSQPHLYMPILAQKGSTDPEELSCMHKIH